MILKSFLAASILGLCVLGQSAGPSGPDVAAKSAVVLDAQSGRVLWAKDANTPRYPASTTKIMTALLLIEHCKPDDEITAPDAVKGIPESSMHLVPGEKVSVHDMLYALMLRSANDGCVAVAYHVAGSVPAFAEMMNQRAKEIGCTNTHFHNPNGLNDTLHTISATDLALIAKEAMKHPEFREVVHTQRYKITRSMNQKDTWMVSKNKWLKKDPTADGVKTGWTIPAGHCYVGSAFRDGYRVITVVLNSNHWQLDHGNMLDWAFASHYQKDAANPGTIIAQEPVTDGSAKSVGVSPEAPIQVILDKGDDGQKLVTTVKLDHALVAPIHKGDKVGQIVVSGISGKELSSAPAVATEDVNASPLAAVKPGANKFSTVVFTAGFIGGVVVLRSKARKMRVNVRTTSTRPLF